MKISNQTLEFSLEPTTGDLTGCRLTRRGNRNLIARKRAFVCIEDGVTETLVGDTEQPERCQVKSNREGIGVTKTFTQVPFDLRQQWCARDDEIDLLLTVRNRSSVQRSIDLYFVVPLLDSNRHVFLAHSDAPLAPDAFDQKMYYYGGDQFRGETLRSLMLPMVTVYQPEEDWGLSILAPVEDRKPLMQYMLLRNNARRSLVIKWCNLRLEGRGTYRVHLTFRAHAGDWRPALQWIKEKYPDHFCVGSRSIYDSEGAMLCSTFQTGSNLKRWKRHGLAWQELHANIFEAYGDYGQESKKQGWSPIINCFNTNLLTMEDIADVEGGEFNLLFSGKKAPRVTREMITNCLKRLKREGIASYIYINPVLCSRTLSDRFADSIARRADGSTFSGYYRGCSMNPDPELSWGQYLLRAAKHILATWPDCAGIFFDEIHYRHFDFAHDDGTTMVNNQPCYNLGFAMEKWFFSDFSG